MWQSRSGTDNAVLDGVSLLQDHSVVVLAVAHHQASGHHVTTDRCGHSRCRAAAVSDGAPSDKLTQATLSLTEVFVLIATLVWSVVEPCEPI